MARSVVRRWACAALLLTTALTPFVTRTAASATVASTQHRVPGKDMNGSGVTTLCYDAIGFSCTSADYQGTSAQFFENGWTSGSYWAYGSSGPNGTRHNCTAYAAYRLELNDVAFPNWTGNGGAWARDAYAHGTPVDQTPEVGSIAQWNYTADGGDVAYVEVVTSAYIEITGDAYTEGTGRHRIAVGSPYWPDNFIHFRDMPPTAAATNHLVAGDFNGDGFSDVAAMYKYPHYEVKVWTFNGVASGLATPQMRWDSGIDKWNWDNAKLVAGDVNGDGRSDVIVFYKYPSSQTKVWVFYGSSTGLKAPVIAWDSGVGGWNWDNIAAVSGDVNGDHAADVVAFYRYPGHQTKAWIFHGSSTGLKAPVLTWDSGLGKWNWDEAKFVAGDINGNGTSDVVAMYEYPNSQTKAWLFYGTSTGLKTPVVGWDSGVGKWNWDNATLVSTNLNGDAYSDMFALYRLPGAETKAYVFYGSVTGLHAPTAKWDSGLGKWNQAHLKLVGGDVNHDSRGDAIALYRYPSNQTKAWVFYGSTTGVAAPGIKWDSGAGGWNWDNL